MVLGKGGLKRHLCPSVGKWKGSSSHILFPLWRWEQGSPHGFHLSPVCWVTLSAVEKQPEPCSSSSQTPSQGRFRFRHGDSKRQKEVPGCHLFHSVPTPPFSPTAPQNSGSSTKMQDNSTQMPEVKSLEWIPYSVSLVVSFPFEPQLIQIITQEAEESHKCNYELFVDFI